MKKPFRLEKLPTDCGQRKALYRTLGPFYKKRYGMKEGPVALEHAKSVTEEVAS
jgi:hypothetical protein